MPMDRRLQLKQNNGSYSQIVGSVAVHVLFCKMPFGAIPEGRESYGSGTALRSLHQECRSDIGSVHFIPPFPPPSPPRLLELRIL